MDSLYLHQLVDEQQITNMYWWVKGHDMQSVCLKDQARAVGWFNLLQN